jgi:hypothetical protein
LKRAAYSGQIDSFLNSNEETILGILVQESHFAIESTQKDAWIAQIRILKNTLTPFGGAGSIYFEFSIPRLGKRIDTVIIIKSVVFVLEFKVGESDYPSSAIDQVYDYALDLKNFHEPSHDCYVVPILIATEAESMPPVVPDAGHKDRLLQPISSTVSGLLEVLRRVLDFAKASRIDIRGWETGRYCPTPTIIEAATALYGGHGVADISRNDAGATNLSVTSDVISEIIRSSRLHFRKSICLVTGVPGAGKTLVGLDIATKYHDKEAELYSVFLSGNGPLVTILREALARDKVRRDAEQGKAKKKAAARSEVKAFIQNVHHFRDDCLANSERPPIEHVALFDEAQRAWNLEQTSTFMLRKKKVGNFHMSEPEFLISCMDRHKDWAVVVCLVGGGQEINTGEAGIGEWIDSLRRKFPSWHLHISSRLTDSEYGAGKVLEQIQSLPHVTYYDELHLGVSMRSFRA